ncbi:CoA-substrate-specific enzyme activase [Candidatus Omnitrophus magneticus]|uniref:CoA-substrate-specific enzyme activase n=1 Tax=Candidatus Omnitrophus magneticus TaxID=1609969 RepID=A0A0F0CMW8_9BACT|nr:CoA-substrate-specific enzyme activase [Candidatus Omnitrophus magneticus]
MNRVVAGRKMGKNIFFQGGTAYNKSVVAAFEKYVGREITVPPNHEVTGAIGMALIARDYVASKNGDQVSRFKGFAIADHPYNVSSFECKGCPNVCEINQVKIEGEKDKLFYGGRCEKYDINKKEQSPIEDLFAFREELLWKPYEEKTRSCEQSGQRPSRGGAAVGIPYIFYMHEFMPYWTTLVASLGFDVVFSPKTNRRVVNLGVETVLSESCFPVKVAHGHVKYLLEEGVKTLLMPSFVNMSNPGDDFAKSSPCPYTQTIPYMAKAAFGDADIISPIVDFTRDEKHLFKELKGAFKRFGVGDKELKEALKKAALAQLEFRKKLREKGKEALDSITERTIVIIGRAYNSFDNGINLKIPKKLASLNVRSIPMDMLPLKDIDIQDVWADMYWRSGQNILKAARYTKNNPLLYPIYIGNFNCGPDSFILKYFKEEMGDKAFLHLEIDEHSADAGAITRCEAFLDSIGNREEHSCGKAPRRNTFPKIDRDTTVYFPRMSDHAFALAASLEYCGLKAEVLPETDLDAIEDGRRHVSGKECYPCIVTTGDIVKKAASPDFDRARSVFFMPSGTGPCRFGQYNVFQRHVLDKMGLDDIQLFSPVQDETFYKDLGLVGSDFSKRTWQGIVATELLIKCLHETRPYEKHPGQCDQLYDKYLMDLYNTLRAKNGDVDDVLKDIRRAFGDVERREEETPRPLIGVIGEIFVRSNRFSNENLENKLEDLGAEVWLSPVEEWMYYDIGDFRALIVEYP